MKINDETYIQIFLCSFLRKLQLHDPRFLFFAIPNGGSRNAREAANLKLAGLLPGAPDLLLIGANHHQFIELKKHKGTLSTQQKDFIKQASGFGWKVDVVYADNPQEAIEKAFPIMERFGYDHQGMSKVSSSVLSSLGGVAIPIGDGGDKS